MDQGILKIFLPRFRIQSAISMDLWCAKKQSSGLHAWSVMYNPELIISSNAAKFVSMCDAFFCDLSSQITKMTKLKNCQIMKKNHQGKS